MATIDRKANKQVNRLQKVFNRHKDKEYKKFKKLPECFRWSLRPDICGLTIIDKFVARNEGIPVMNGISQDGGYLDVTEEELAQFLDKTDETVSEVVKALLNCGISIRAGKLHLAII